MTERERTLLLEGIGAREQTLDPETLKRDILTLVCYCTNKEGRRLTPEMVDSGLRTIDDLCDEVHLGEINIGARLGTFERWLLEKRLTSIFLTWDVLKRRALASGWKLGFTPRRVVKQSFKVEVRIRVPGYVLVEAYRRYLKRGVTVPTTRRKYVRGTQKRNETTLSAAINEVGEELGLQVDQRLLILARESLKKHQPQEGRESEVYYAFLANDIEFVYDYYLDEPPRPLDEIWESAVDRDVVVGFKWEPDDAIVDADALRRALTRPAN